MKGKKVMFKGALCSNEVGEGGEREEGRVGARNRRVARERGQTDIRIIVHIYFITQPTPRQGHKPNTCFNIERTRDHKTIITELTILSMYCVLTKWWMEGEGHD